MMKNVNELRTLRADAWKAARDFLEEHSREDGTMSASDVAAYEKLEAKVVDIGKEIERVERLKDMDDEMAKPTSKPLFTNPGASFRNVPALASDAYKNAMMNAVRTNWRQIDNVLMEGVQSSGGYLVPDEMDHRLIEYLEGENVVRKLATVITTAGDHRINISATKPAAAWTEEGETITFSDATFAQKTLGAHKLCVGIKITEELLEDSAFDLESFILKAFAKALGNAEEDAFMNGDGVNKPAGIFDPEKGGEISVTAASANLKADEIIDLVYSLKRAYRQNACFLMHDSTLAQIRKLKDGNGQYLWQPSTQAGEPDKLLGYPIYTSEFISPVEAGKPVIAFGDFSYYNIGDRGVRSFSELKEVFAVNGEQGLLMRQRVDGCLLLPEAVKILKVKG